MQPIDVGTLLAGKYRLEALIGRGGMGSVWRAEHLGLTAPVAVKLLDLHDFGGSGEALARFHREARAAAAIRSPHVVQILDHGIDQHLGAPFIVMELMDGESLAQRLARQGRISPGETARVMTHVSRALSRAHDAGIVHRDLKPDNVFLVRNEDEEVAKVLDFGIAKAHGHALAGDSGTRTGTVMGTAYYMSPEQISGQKSVDLRTDLWALGVMTYECLSGVRPFDAETIGGLTLKICVEPMPIPSQHALVPPGFDQWFARCVNRDPAQRFASAREAAEALRLVCTGATGDMMVSYDGAARPMTPAPVTGSAIASTAAPVTQSNLGGQVAHRSPSPWPWLALAGVLMVGALTGAALWWRARADHASAEPPLATSPAAAVAPASPVTAPEIVPAAAPPAIPEPAPSAKATPSAPSAASPAASAPEAPAAVAAPAQTAKRAVVAAKPSRPAATVATAARPTATVLVKPKPAVVRDVIDDRH